MICREQKETIIMIRQHEHGLLAGSLAVHCDAPRFRQGAESRRKEVLWAVAHHDRGWIDLDETPFWNDAADAPYTFIDFPVVPKLTFYRRGLDEIEAVSPYGALLCSRHFDRLIEASGESGSELDSYQEGEARRQERISAELGLAGPAEQEQVSGDAHLLQFCDDLSLYLALNEPGSPKSAEHVWWREGFAGSEELPFAGGRRMTAEWKDASALMLNPFPFGEPLEVVYKLRLVTRERIAAAGIARAYHEAAETDCRIRLIPRT